MIELQQLENALKAANIPFDGVGLVNRIDPSWHVVKRSDGLLVRVDYNGATAAQVTAGDALVLAADLTNKTIRSFATLVTAVQTALAGNPGLVTKLLAILSADLLQRSPTLLRNNGVPVDGEN